MWKVLLVEDEVFVRESVREIISWEELGFTVIGESGNGTEALAMIIQDTPDLVLTDIVMPGMDGLELLKQTRQAGLKTKFVMLTCMGSSNMYAVQWNTGLPIIF
ncbi:response regulator [Paenibacillus sp. OVF10]|nr:response regulator [Paenibacillus sp. OVF10]